MTKRGSAITKNKPKSLCSALIHISIVIINVRGINSPIVVMAKLHIAAAYMLLCFVFSKRLKETAEKCVSFCVFLISRVYSLLYCLFIVRTREVMVAAEK